MFKEIITQWEFDKEADAWMHVGTIEVHPDRYVAAEQCKDACIWAYGVKETKLDKPRLTLQWTPESGVTLMAASACAMPLGMAIKGWSISQWTEWHYFFTNGWALAKQVVAEAQRVAFPSAETKPS